MVEIVPLLIQIVVGTIIVAPILWLVGRALVGRDKAKFLDAIWIVLLGTIINAVVGGFVGDLVAGFGALIAAVITLIIWLALIKHFFDCGWLMALVIAIIAVIVMFVIAVIVGILFVGLLFLGI